MKRHSKILSFNKEGEFYARIADRNMTAGKMSDALYYYRKAAETEPENPEYIFDLCQLYTELGYFDISNIFLWRYFFSTENPDPECYFGIGCNYMGVQDIDNAYTMFMKYSEVAESGEYEDDIADVLETLQFMQEESEEEEAERPRLVDLGEKLASEGRHMLDRGELDGAEDAFKSVLNTPAATVGNINSLAMVCYEKGRREEALYYLDSILKKHPNDLLTVSNKVIVLTDSGRTYSEEAEKLLSVLEGADISSPELLYKIATKSFLMGRPSFTLRLLGRLYADRPFDFILLHYMAAAQYNTGDFKGAQDSWMEVEKILPDNGISDYYMSLASRKLRGEDAPDRVPYHFQVDGKELERRLGYLHNLCFDGEKAKELWHTDGSLYRLLNWGMSFIYDPDLRGIFVALLALIGDKDAEVMLREALMRRDHSEKAKEMILPALKSMGAKEPFISYANGSLVEIVVSMFPDELKYMPEAHKNVVYAIVQRIQEYKKSEEYIRSVIRIWKEYTENVPDAKIRENRPEPWAAALELYANMQSGIKTTKKQLCADYGISLKTLNRYYSMLKEGLGL